MSKSLLEVFDYQWRELRTAVADLRNDVDRYARRERAEVAASVPVYATTGDLPAAGQLGRLAAVQADSRLYFDNGTSWVVVV